MKIPMTRDLLLHLHETGYNYLVAENQAQNEWYVFEPVKWDEEAFFAECLTTSFDDHMILSISTAINSFHFEDYLNHEVILPEQ